MNRRSFSQNVASLLLLALVLACAVSLHAHAEDLKAPAATSSNPLVEDDTPNPLLEDEDPFIGIYEGANMTVQMAAGKDATLIGTVKKGGRSFPLSAKREGQSLKGLFSHNDKHFAFTAALEGSTLLFTTSDRVFKLDRQQAKPVAPAPAAPLPAIEPVPRPPQFVPKSEAPAKPVTPGAPAMTVPLAPPPAPPTVPATKDTPDARGMPDPADPSVIPVFPVPKGAKANPGKAWAGFPNGTYVVMEEVVARDNRLPISNRWALVLQTVEGGKEMILPHKQDGMQWVPLGKPEAWLGNGSTAQELGFKPGETSTQALSVGPSKIECTVTQYTLAVLKAGVMHSSKLELWTAPSLAFPSQSMNLPEGVLRIEGSIVRMVRTGDDGTKVDFGLAAVDQPLRIGETDLLVALFKGTATTAPKGRLDITMERYLSPQVPGGIAKLQVIAQIGETRTTTTGNAVEIGMLSGIK